MTNEDFGKKLKLGLILWFASSAATFLYLGHLVNDPWKKAVTEAAGGPIASYRYFLAQFVFAAFTLLVCSMVGAFLSERYKLPGTGDPKKLGELKKYIVPTIVLAALFGYFLHDRIFFRGHDELGWPAMTPEGFGWSAAYVAFGALNKEVFFRFGMLTLFAGLFRGARNGWAIAASSVFAASLSMKELTFPGHTLGFDVATVSVYAWALVLNLFLGALYVKRGLWASMAARACVEGRFIIYAVLLILKPYLGGN